MIMTDHATYRRFERNIPQSAINLIFNEHDRTTMVGDGVSSYWFSRDRIRKLREEGLSLALAEVIRNAVVLVDKEAGTVVSVIRTYANKGRQYRQDRRRRKTRRSKWARY